MRPHEKSNTPATKFPKGSRVKMNDDREAIVLESELENADYLLAYKRKDGSWSQTNAMSQQIVGLWVDVIKADFKADVVAVTKTSITLEFHNSKTLEIINENLVGKRVHIQLTERK